MLRVPALMKVGPVKLAATPMLRTPGPALVRPPPPPMAPDNVKVAAESGAKIALLYGGDEIAKGVVKLRDLTDRSEREVARADVVATVRDFFTGG